MKILTLKKILLNLDGYQINVFLEPLKKFLRKYNINIALIAHL